ncbi:tetratricopeptide (TPR) repeat protein [Paenibacillus sp. DS2015]|uniref:DNA-binding protein n=1 Tax=Paenibacillus sp. DS2015 TaxID=3373917 RepID=UPI003D216B64
MSPATTIRAEIINHIESFGHTLTSFGQASGINKGVISAILNNNPPKPISVRQVDLITEALGYDEGALYNMYVDECFVNEKPNGRRISSFLIRCAELGKEDTIDYVLSRLMENLTYLTLIFSIAERLYISGKTKESIIFYKCVAENEKYQHSERLAISQYRIFRASIGLDAEQSMEVTLQFIAYRKRLPENYQLDALVELMNIYYTMNKWEKVEQYADELITLSTIVLQNEKRLRLGNRSDEPLVTDKPLVNYYAYGYLMKGVALEQEGSYKEALKYVAGYADLSWIEGLDQEGHLIVERYHMWSIANTYTLEILMGNVNILPEYTQLLHDNPQEILPGLLTIMKSVNRHGFSVDDILVQFNDAILEYEKDPFSDLSNGYTNVYNRVRYADLCYQIAIYHFTKMRYREGIRHTLQSITINANINRKSEVIDSMSLFDRYRRFATEEELKQYSRIIKGGCNHENIGSFNSCSS